MPIGLMSDSLLRLLDSRLDLDSLFPALLDVILELTGAQRGFLMIQEDEMRIRAARNSSRQDLPSEHFSGSSSIVRKVENENITVYVPAIPLDQHFSATPSVRASSLYSVLCIPLRRASNNSPLGILYVDSSSPLHANLEEAEFIRLMEGFANHVAIAIENAELFRRLDQKNREIEELNQQLQKYLELQTGKLEGIQLLFEKTQRELGSHYRSDILLGNSPAMGGVYRILEKVVDTDATILVQGESGTGKELIARFIHYNGARAEKPLVSINCAAFQESILESELFGHRKGAFTGADQNKPGLFQVADQGTLFLDEIGEMKEDMQKKLLRVLQNGEVRPVGSGETIHVDVRIIAATNKNLKDLVEEGKFREDLFFRLNVIQIDLPPLRDRKEDLPLLIKHFLQSISKDVSRGLKEIPKSLMDKYMKYQWPGNVRELENELRRFLILESEYRFPQFAAGQKTADSMNLAEMEKKLIYRALETTRWNKTRAAELLGIPIRTLYDRLKKYDIESD